MPSRRKSLYVVLKGHQPGVYPQWEGSEGAKIQVEGFGNAVYKGFYTAEEASNWLKSQAKEPLPPPLMKWLIEQERKAANHSSKSLKSLTETHLQAGGTVIFTDGATLGNPGRGGYAAAILQNENRREISGGFRLTTNNRMELYACIAALESIQPPQKVLLITDSAYIYRATMQGWLQRWAENGWKQRRGRAVENRDLWQRLHRLCQCFTVEVYWIKGHNATLENERCDWLANRAAQKPNLPEDQGYQMRNAIA
ncbi:MAG: ribonuclease HI [Anaerolineales bacterium]